MTEGKRPNLNFPDGKDFRPSKGKAWAKPFNIRSPNKLKRKGNRPIKSIPIELNRFVTRKGRLDPLPTTKNPPPPQQLQNMSVTRHEVTLERGIVMCWTSLNAIFFKKKEDEKEIVSIQYTSRKYAMFYYEHNRISWKE